MNIYCKKIVLATGTFLRGKCYIGKFSYPAGRHLRNSANVESPSIKLAETIEKNLNL
jgi:tRNA U34 5-carboxymethylaminomethyl modifying enzyme MnmG/GidA